MTASTEPSASGWRVQGDLGRWREHVAQQQESAMPQGSVAVSCSAPVGTGGLGRHLQEIAEASDRLAQQTLCISGSSRARASSARRLPAPAEAAARVLALPLPLRPATRGRLSAADFDAYAARQLRPADHLIAFNGQALAQFKAARRLNYRSVSVVSANSHMRHAIRQHKRAIKQYPLEGTWAAHMLRRNLREYERSARVYVASRYIRESFLVEGFPEDRLSWFPLSPHPRFDSVGLAAASDRFEIVYVGSLSVHKGVPLLIDAVRRLPHADLRLTLVGGWGTRGMRKFVQRSCARDSRIVAGPGDPLAHLRKASLCVHPAYEDGFGYAPAEALASGVPLIVSEDTGMKELICSASEGVVVPTGDLDVLATAIDTAYRGELFDGR